MGCTNVTIEAPLPPLDSVGSAIVKQGQNTSDPTSWLLVGGQRYWIPSGGVYNCLRSSGVPGPYLLSNAELDARPDQTGQHADCGQGNDPRGYLDAVWSPGPGKVGVRGWTTDPNVRTRSIDVHVYVGGPAGSAAAAGFNIGATKAYRPDVNSAFPGDGNYHGYDTVVQTSKSGTQQVCAYGINAGPGGNVLLGCTNVTIEAGTSGFTASSATGFPTGGAYVQGPCVVQEYSGGAWGRFLRVGQGGPSYTVRHGMLEGYLSRANGAMGPLGCPTSDEYQFGDGSRQNFEGGILEWHPGFSGAVAVSGRTPSPEECLPAGELVSADETATRRTMDCLVFGGAKIDQVVLAGLGEYADSATKLLASKTVSVASYQRDGKTVVSYIRYQKGLGDIAAQVPAKDARYLSKIAGRAFLVVAATDAFFESYYDHAGNDWAALIAVAKAAGTVGGGVLGAGAATAVASAACATGVGCVIVGGVVVAVGGGVGAWLGGSVTEAVVEMVFEDVEYGCMYVGFIPFECPTPA